MATAEVPMTKRIRRNPQRDVPSFRQLLARHLSYKDQEEFSNWLILKSAPVHAQPVFWLGVRANSEALEPERWLCTDVAFSRTTRDVENAYDHYLEELKTHRPGWKIACGFVLCRKKLLDVFHKYSQPVA